MPVTFSASKRVFEGGTLGDAQGAWSSQVGLATGTQVCPRAQRARSQYMPLEQWHVETVCRAEYMQDHRAGVGHGHRQPGVGDGIGVRERRDADDQVTARPCREQLRFVRTPHSTAAVGL